MTPKVLFTKIDVFDVVEQSKARIKAAYLALPDDQALDDKVIERLKAKYMLDVPVLKTSEMTYEEGKTRIDARRLPNRVFFPGGGPVMEDVTELTIHVPFDGDPGVFNIAPSAFNSLLTEGEIAGQELLLRLAVFDSNYDIQAHIDREIRQINWNLTHLREKEAYFSQELGTILAQAIASRKRAIESRSTIATRLNIPQRQAKPQPAPTSSTPAQTAPLKKHALQGRVEMWDVFISHASEDKSYVEPLVKALEVAGVSVWYDRLVMEWGDDLRQKIDNGLINCRYGIVILSKHFLAKKKWTEHELNGLFAREKASQKLVLPIWHGITRDDLLQYSPALADRLAKVSKSDSHEDIVEGLMGILGRPIAQQDTIQIPTSPRAAQKRDTIAYAFYAGPGVQMIQLLVRKSPLEDFFVLENADGATEEGTLQEIAIKYVLADKSLTLAGYKRMNLFGSGKDPEFNL